jgi:hypothetical protein
MAEGDYFHDEEKPKKKKKEPELIEDFNVMVAEYNSIVQSLKLTDKLSNEHVVALRTMLTGTKAGPDDEGELGEVMNRLRKSPLYNTGLGKEVLSMLKNIKDLDFWGSRYETYLEEYIEGLKIIVLSAFMQIRLARGEIAKQKEKIERLQYDITPKVRMAGEERRHFMYMLEARLKTYIAERDKGDDKAATLAIGRTLAICGKDPEKRAIAEAKLKKIGAPIIYTPFLQEKVQGMMNNPPEDVQETEEGSQENNSLE